MKNKLTDLNDHLFAQLERLNDEEVTPEKLEGEIARSAALISVGKAVIENGRLMLDATKTAADLSTTVMPQLPKILSNSSED